MTRFHSGSDIEKIIRLRSTPALLTRMSSWPYRSIAVARSFSPVAHSATSPAATTACCLRGDLRRHCLHGVPRQVVEHQPCPLAPASASDSARPRPLPAPVTMATRPVSVSASSIPP